MFTLLRRAAAIVVLSICAPALGAVAADSTTTIQLRDAHARIMPGAQVGAAYVRITNAGKEPDRLTAVSTPIAGKAEIHSMTDDNGVMKMRPVADVIEVKPGETVELKPGGLHIMLTDLKSAPKPGESIPLTLIFQKAGAQTVTATVDKPVGHGH